MSTLINPDSDAITKAGAAAVRALASLELPPELVRIPLAGAMYLEAMRAPHADLWWPSGSNDDEVANWLARQHTEFSLLVTAAISLAQLFNLPSTSEWELEFDEAYLFFMKGLAPAAASVQLLTHARCYADAFAIVRGLHTQANLLALFALGTHLFDEWLKNPKEARFLDGHVRSELANHRIFTFPHIYEHSK
jgi:hypothetical protein